MDWEVSRTNCNTGVNGSRRPAMTMDEISMVSGGDRGDAAAAGAVVSGIAGGGGAAAAVARAAGVGALRGVAFGAVGIIGGAIVFGGIVYVYRMTI